MKVWL